MKIFLFLQAYLFRKHSVNSSAECTSTSHQDNSLNLNQKSSSNCASSSKPRLSSLTSIQPIGRIIIVSFALFSTCSLRAETPETSNNNSSSESSVSSQGSVECSPSSSSGVTLPPFFLSIDSLEITKVIPPPPEDGSVLAADDLTIQHYAMATATPEQVDYAMGIIEDSVFDYSEVLGAYFKPELFPVTAAFFKKVRNDTTVANLAAKNNFQHARPLTWRKMTPDDKDFGYSYPSGHTTRAFVWAELLSQLFPEFKDAIFKEAEKKAWSRVILGRHYPSDVCSGQLYAHYLVQKFLDNPEFEKEWTAVQAEVASVSVIARN